MPTQAVPLGMPVTLLANVVYALPGVSCTLYTDGAAPTITQSNTLAFTASTPVTLTAGASSLAGLFIKCAADTVVVLKQN
jgi:hypothetical protein